MRAGPVVYALWMLSTAGWWALALAPLQQAPDWLLRTRQVCFGTLPSGLPDGGGWLMLAAPLPMLAALVIIYHEDLRACRRDLIGLMVALPLIGAAWIGQRVEQGLRPLPPDPAVEALPEAYPRTALALPGFRLFDQHGRPWTSSMLAGEPTVLTFAYGHCATVCPGLIRSLKEVRRPVRRVIVTLDPWRDTCGSLPDLSRRWELPEGSVVLSGEVEQVAALTGALNLPTERDPRTGEIAHPGMVFVLDRQGRVAYTFLSPDSSWLEEAIRRAWEQD